MNRKTYHIFFSNLSNKLRLDIISSLREENKCVNEISSELGVEQSKLSHALSSLKKCNLVYVEIKGKQRIYSLNKKTILPILKIIDAHAKDYCNGGKGCVDCNKC